MKRIYLLVHVTASYSNPERKTLLGFHDEAEAKAWRDRLEPVVKGTVEVEPVEVQGDASAKPFGTVGTFTGKDFFQLPASDEQPEVD